MHPSRPEGPALRAFLSFIIIISHSPRHARVTTRHARQRIHDTCRSVTHTPWRPWSPGMHASHTPNAHAACTRVTVCAFGRGFSAREGACVFRATTRAASSNARRSGSGRRNLHQTQVYPRHYTLVSLSRACFQCFRLALGNPTPNVCPRVLSVLQAVAYRRDL